MVTVARPIRLGIFPTPDAARVHDVVELAVVADTSAIDLVTVQDHPYNAAHADALTLLTWIAARTSQVRVGHNVANLPLRPPVTLAKTVATLDLLSGGRADLGLGAGGFWDAIEAAGGPRRSPKEAVDALVEAVGIIREVWRGERALRVDGEHYRVQGMRPGPAPLGDPQLWIGAYGPRMLRVTGRLADGWLPSMGYLPPEKLGEANARIDEAALKAGRAPQDVERMYNVHVGAGGLAGGPREWVEQLAELALEERITTFVLATDDPDRVRTLGLEVGPALRELVEAEQALRAGTTHDAEDGAQDEAHDGSQPAPVPVSAPVELEGVRVTPDDGTRLLDEDPWDEPSRPTATAPDGAPRSYSPQQLAAPQHLVDVHDHLRRELDQVRDVVRQVQEGHLSVGRARSVISTMAMRQNAWTLGAFCETYCRLVTGHHTLEDRSVFPHLRQSEPEVGPVIDRLEQEHEVIADVLDRLDRALVALVAEDGHTAQGREALAALGRVVDLLTDTLLSHLAYEERELAGPLARHGFG